MENKENLTEENENQTVEKNQKEDDEVIENLDDFFERFSVPSEEDLNTELNKELQKEQAKKDKAESFDRLNIPTAEEIEVIKENDIEELINRAGDVPTPEEINIQITEQAEQDNAESFDRLNIPTAEEIETLEKNNSEEITPAKSNKTSLQEENLQTIGDIAERMKDSKEWQKLIDAENPKIEETEVKKRLNPSSAINSELKNILDPQLESNDFETAVKGNDNNQEKNETIPEQEKKITSPEASDINEKEYIDEEIPTQEELEELEDPEADIESKIIGEELVFLNKKSKEAEQSFRRAEILFTKTNSPENTQALEESKKAFQSAYQEYVSSVYKIAADLNMKPNEALRMINKRKSGIPNIKSQILRNIKQTSQKPKESSETTPNLENSEPSQTKKTPPKTPNENIESNDSETKTALQENDANIIDAEFRIVPINEPIEKKKSRLEKINTFLEARREEVEESIAKLEPKAKYLYDSLIKIAKSKYTHAAIGAALIGISIAVPPVGGAAWITNGLISGILPVEYGLASKVIGGAAGGFFLRKLIERRNNSRVGENKEQKQLSETIITVEAKEIPTNTTETNTPVNPETNTENTPITNPSSPESEPLINIPKPRENQEYKKPEPIISKKPEKKNEKIQEKIDQALEEIRLNIDKQPASIQKMYSEMKDKFQSVITTQDGNEFIFAGISNGKVLALAKDPSNEDIWKTRFFRYSQSDNQWKILPGERPNGTYLKGEESNPNHHYVQSAKIADQDIYKAIASLKTTNDYDFEEYIAREPSQITPGKEQFVEELEFKEEYLTLKNKEWAYYQNICQEIFQQYKYFISDANQLKNLSPEGDFYKKIELIGEEFKDIKEAIDEAYQDKDLENYIKETNNDINVNKLQVFKNSANPKLKKIAEAYEKNIGNYLERIFQLSDCPKDMKPDFSKEKILSNYKKGDILIEEYAVENAEKDTLVFAMAHDSHGRVYIDNIYNPYIEVNDYGASKQICQMGHLIFKPEDYTEQTFGIPEKYKKELSYESGFRAGENTGYTDINAFWQNIPLIKNYKEELERRISNPEPVIIEPLEKTKATESLKEDVKETNKEIFTEIELTEEAKDILVAKGLQGEEAWYEYNKRGEAVDLEEEAKTILENNELPEENWLI